MEHSLSPVIPEAKTIFSPAEAAKYLKIPVLTLNRLRLSDTGPDYTKVGKTRGMTILYRQCDLDAWRKDNPPRGRGRPRKNV